MRPTRAAAALLLLCSSISARASTDHPLSSLDATAPSLYRGGSDRPPTSFAIRRILRRHHNGASGTLHEKRLLGLLPDLTGSNDNGGGEDGQTGAPATSPPVSTSVSHTGSSSSSGQLAFAAPSSSVGDVLGPTPAVGGRDVHGSSLSQRQLLSGLGDAVGGVISGVGDSIGNALGENGDGNDSSSGSDDSSSGQNSGSSGTGNSSGDGDRSTASSTSSSGTSSSGNRGSDAASSSRANSNATPASTSPSSSANAGTSSSVASAEDNQRQASESSSAAAASQASSLSQSAAEAASANAASLASASVNSAIAATQMASSSTPSAVLVTSSLPGGTTVVTSIASLAPNESAGTYGGGSGSGRTGAADGSNENGTGSGTLSTAAIVGIAVPLGVIGMVVLIWTVVRKRQQARTRALQPLDFAPAYGSSDSPNALTRRSQESWLGGGHQGGRPMSGISDVEPDMMPVMEETSHEDHLHRTGPAGGGFYEEGMALSMPPMSYNGAAAGRSVDGRGGSAVGSSDSHGLAYGWSNGYAEDGGAASGYYHDQPTDLTRSDSQQNPVSGYGYTYRPDVEEPRRPQESYRHDDAYADDADPFAHGTQFGTELTKSSSRWSG